MNKLAHPDALKWALLSMLGGAGAYGGMRLGKDMVNASQPPEAPNNELQITLPQSRMPQPQQMKMANDPDTVWNQYILPTLAIGGGASGGFLGASKLYEMAKRKQINGQLQNVNANYMQTLQNAHQKIGGIKTPLVDKLCEGLVAKIGEKMKQASFTDAQLDAISPHINTASNTPIHDIASAGIHGAMNSPIFRAMEGTGGIAALLAAGATYGIGKRMDSQRNANKAQTTLPTEVKLNVA